MGIPIRTQSDYFERLELMRIGNSVSTQRGPFWSTVGRNFQCSTATRTASLNAGLLPCVLLTVTSPFSSILAFTRTVTEACRRKSCRAGGMKGFTRIFNRVNASWAPICMHSLSVVRVLSGMLMLLLVQVVICPRRSSPIDCSGSSSEICLRSASIVAASLLAHARFHDSTSADKVLRYSARIWFSIGGVFASLEELS